MNPSGSTLWLSLLRRDMHDMTITIYRHGDISEIPCFIACNDYRLYRGVGILSHWDKRLTDIASRRRWVPYHCTVTYIIMARCSRRAFQPTQLQPPLVHFVCFFISRMCFTRTSWGSTKVWLYIVNLLSYLLLTKWHEVVWAILQTSGHTIHIPWLIYLRGFVYFSDQTE